MPDAPNQEKRRHMRFRPDEIEIALLQFTDAPPGDSPFEAEAAGLVIEEAYGGCGLVTLSRTGEIRVEKGARCRVKVGSLGPLPAEVRWVRQLDEDVAKIGIEYIDTR